MISVVICSVNSSMAQKVKSNIDNTIGLPWEPIIIDNSISPRGITAVYNEGARKASHLFVCFIHEDVEIKTQDWGKKLIEYFNADAGLGMIGLAGARYKSRTPSGWMTFEEKLDRYTITHINKEGKTEKMHFDEPPYSDLKEVVCLDGVFMCIRKEVVMEFPFDEQLLQRFHLYDIDISFRISRKHKVSVCFSIDLLHYTQGGDYGDKWIDETLKWHKQYDSALPVTQPGLTINPDWEAQIARMWLKRLRTEKITIRNKMRWLRASGSFSRPQQWGDVSMLFLFRPLKFILRKNK